MIIYMHDTDTGTGIKPVSHQSYDYLLTFLSAGERKKIIIRAFNTTMQQYSVKQLNTSYSVVEEISMAG